MTSEQPVRAAWYALAAGVPGGVGVMTLDFEWALLDPSVSASEWQFEPLYYATWQLMVRQGYQTRVDE